MRLVADPALVVIQLLALTNALQARDAPNDLSLPKRQDKSSAEHVTLSECSGSGSSYDQGAYFSTDPNSKPSDKGNVTWTEGHTGDWDNSTVRVGFPYASFTATLGGDVPEGALAGTGDNGYSNNGGFRCWRRSSVALYQDGDASCNMIYDCDHEPSPSPSSNTTSADTSSTADDDDRDERIRKGISGGTVAGIVVGAVVFVVSVLTSAFLIWLHFKRKAARAAANGGDGAPPAFYPNGGGDNNGSYYPDAAGGAPGMAPPYYGGAGMQQQSGPQELHNTHMGPQELHTQSWYVPEMAGGGAGHTWEMPSPASGQAAQQEQQPQQQPPGYHDAKQQQK